MVNKYIYVNKIYEELRKKGYSREEAMRYMVRMKILAKNKQQLIPIISIKHLKEVLREAKKERKMY